MAIWPFGAAKPSAELSSKLVADTLALIPAHTAQEICQHMDLTDEAAALLSPLLTPVEFLKLLIEHEHWLPAVQFLAYGLPNREALRWTCICLQTMQQTSDDPSVTSLVGLAQQWVRQPTDENRLAAAAAAKKTAFDTPAAWAAAAAGWGQASEDAPDIPAPDVNPQLAARGAAGAIAIAAGQSQQADQVYCQFLKIGIELASGHSKPV